MSTGRGKKTMPLSDNENKTSDEKKQSEMKAPVITLPYIHPKIELHHLKDNLKLYSDTDIQKIRDLNLSDGRIKSTYLLEQGIQLAEWDVIKFNNRYYAIYKGSKAGGFLGAGAAGQVKLAQDLDTGDLLVLKVTPKMRVHKLYPDKFTNEKKFLE